jgi:HAE1 family hydrophobic/amphiphilic exporter-1
VLVQNRVSVAVPRLPDQVQKFGVTVRKKSPDLMMVVHLISPDGTLDQQYISNYATINIKDVLTRLDGVGDTVVFGARDYSMRIWLDPARIQARGLAASDVVDALRANNVAVSAGAINQPPATSPGGFQIAVQTLGRLTSPSSSTTSWSRPTATAASRGSRHRPRRAWRPGLQPERLSQRQGRDRNRASSSGRAQTRSSRQGGVQHHGRARQELPAGARLSVAYDTTGFIKQSVDEVVQHAVRSRRAGGGRHHPVPADLARRDHPDRGDPGIAGRHLLHHAGVWLLAEQPDAVRLVLAIGIVVDDAIVVVETSSAICSRPQSEGAAHKTMDEVGGALLAIALVLCAVFIPTAFIDRHLRRVLSAVRADDRHARRDFVLRIADAVAGAGRTAAQAAMATRAPRHLEDHRYADR